MNSDDLKSKCFDLKKQINIKIECIDEISKHIKNADYLKFMSDYKNKYLNQIQQIDTIIIKINDFENGISLNISNFEMLNDDNMKD